MAVVAVVEDDPDIRRVVDRVLGRDGHEVHGAGDGVAGLELIVGLRPDAAVLDWMMPAMNGLELCRRVRATSGIAATGLLFLTARAFESDVRQGLAAGADAYLVKPFRPADLRASLAEVVMTARTRADGAGGTGAAGAGRRR